MILDKLSKREKSLSLATITVVLAAFGYVLILEPLTDHWGDLNRQIRQKTLKLNKNLRILEKEELIRSEFKKYAQQARSLGTDEEVIASLLKIIEKTANSTSLRITNIRPRPAKDAGLYREFIFEVISESNLEGLLGFIYELQNSNEVLKVKKLTLTLKSGNSDDLRSVMEITKVSVK